MNSHTSLLPRSMFKSNTCICSHVWLLVKSTIHLNPKGFVWHGIAYFPTESNCFLNKSLIPPKESEVCTWYK